VEVAARLRCARIALSLEPPGQDMDPKPSSGETGAPLRALIEKLRTRTPKVVAA